MIFSKLLNINLYSGFKNRHSGGVASCGSSVEEAFKNLKEAVELYLENARELGLLEQIEAE